MKKMRLKKDHPTAQKIQKIFGLMDRMGLYITVVDGEISLTDKQTNNVYMIEDMNGGTSRVADFPPSFDYKITYLKDD